jgi:signal transduction histidine kinase
MNNPLAYVLVNVEMARKDLATMGDAGRRGHDALTIALEGVDRMRTIVRDLLVLSRGETVTTVPIDITAVVDSTLSLAAEEIRRKARLVRDLRPVPTVRATDARIAQIVLNLVSNALQAMPEGTPAENELVVVTRPAEDDRVLLEVRDNGVGIPAEHLSRVFEPFFTTKEGRGTGLGLPISQRLVVELGGEIVVSSSPEGGTAVRVFLPGAG